MRPRLPVEHVDRAAVFSPMSTYRAAVGRINVYLMRIVARHGSGFAFLSRTV
jgi:hypothetical protein